MFLEDGSDGKDETLPSFQSVVEDENEDNDESDEESCLVIVFNLWNFNFPFYFEFYFGGHFCLFWIDFDLIFIFGASLW